MNASKEYFTRKEANEVLMRASFIATCIISIMSLLFDYFGRRTPLPPPAHFYLPLSFLHFSIRRHLLQ